MKFGTWLGLVALLCAAGCSSSGKKTANQPTSMALAEALSSGLAFKNEKKLSGVIPAATATDVTVTQDDPPLTLSPGDSDVIMSLDADNPNDASDPVTAMLVQFEDSKNHSEIPVKATGDGGVGDGGTGTQHYEVSFSLEDGICKNFCKGEFTVVMIQALKLKKGGVSSHVKRDFKLDCREKGAEICEADKPDGGKGGKSGSSGGGGDAGASTGGGSLTGINALNGQLLTFSGAGCKCAGQTGKMCRSGGLDATAVTCVKTALTDNSAMTGVDGWASCVAQNLKAVTTTCVSCATGACDPSMATGAAATNGCKALPAAVQTAVDDCKLDVGPGSTDASMP